MSLIRHHFLAISFVIAALIIFSNPICQVIILVLSFLYFYSLIKNGSFLILIILFVFLITHVSEPLIPKKEFIKKEVIVEEIHHNYAVVSSSNERYLLYPIEDSMKLKDKIQIEGIQNEIVSFHNKDIFQFDRYMQKKKINASIYVKKYQIIASSNEIKAKLYRYIDGFENKKVHAILRKMFYRINEESQSYLFYVSGGHLLFLALLISKLFSCSYQKCVFIIAFCFLLLFPVTTYLIRIYIFAFVALFFNDYNHREQTGLAILTCLWMDESLLYDIGFLFPVLLRIVFQFRITSISNNLISMLLVFPFQLYAFHECHPILLICYRWVRFVSGCNFVIAVLTLLFPFLQSILLLMQSVIDLMIYLINHSFLIIGKPAFWWLIIWSITMYHLISTQENQRKRLLVIFLLMIMQCFQKELTWYGEVTFIDVGQGDCILVREPFFGEVLLIDVAGKAGSDLAMTTILPVLKSKGIKKINKIVITHEDYDHSGSLSSLLQKMEVEEVMKEREDFSLSYLSFNAYSAEEGVDENENSIVLFSRINHLNYLFLADIPKKIEKRMLEEYPNIHADIVKIAHHGSNTSSDIDFIHQIHPRVAVISSGKNNRYHHPHEEVLTILEKENCYVANTQQVGSISIYFHYGFNFYQQEDGRISILPW